VPAVSQGQWAQITFAHKAGKKSKMKTVLEKLKEFFMSLYERYETRRKQKETFNKLISLSDRELNDMGLARGDIYSVAYSKNCNDYRHRGMA